ncbi:Ribose import permease protein RbsC [Pleomorphomonas sp. T1.2MG-36]|uniref:ABC transporter permease n=1 Tax=Pleomorphomonas sp. T1.2MG-36 TaxID=3041167 RepID=UPI0024778476|nr:ABC transporter permease [Pleomorphomonas sp. T1.2MG-36]CAI9415750.1 Ribose import permease protein RbsC [Pleomorphomonas sp. T1.2MG-36]
MAINNNRPPEKSVLARVTGIKESGIILAIILMGLVITIANPNFLTPYNFQIVARQVSFIAIVAAGQTLVLLLGGIDLSVGAIAGLSAILGAMMMTSGGIDPFLSMGLAVVFGLMCGAINGLLIAKLKLNAFIVTLATGEVFAGAILVLTKGYAINGIPEIFQVLGQGTIGPVPVPVAIMLVIFAILAWVTTNTPFGRSVFAVGGNRDASRFAGLHSERIEIIVYAISGGAAALAGMMFVSRMNAGQPTIGASWLMPSITAAIIGGTSLSGGVGTMFGTLLGALFMALLGNGIVLMNVSSYWERVIIGLFVLIAVIVDLIRRRGSGAPFLPRWMNIRRRS